MRLAILSDIHGNAAALEAVLEDLKQMGGADQHWILGDLLTMGPRPVEVMKLLRELPNAVGLRGNHDRYLTTFERRPVRPAKDEAQFREYLRWSEETHQNFLWTLKQISFADYEYVAKLRHDLDLEVPGYGWIVGFHGTPGNDEGVIIPTTSDEEILDQLLDREGRLAIGGHTHMAMDRDLGRWRYINAGSIGLPQDEIRACYALITIENGQANVDLRRISYDMEAVIKDLEQCGNPSWHFMAGRLRKPLETPEQQAAEPGQDPTV